MSLSKKQSKPIEYSLYVKVKCPACDADDKEIFITLPAQGLPKNIRCFNCNGVIDIQDLYTKGKELICRAETIAPKKLTKST
jgi:hypothetical protein